MTHETQTYYHNNNNDFVKLQHQLHKARNSSEEAVCHFLRLCLSRLCPKIIRDRVRSA